MSDVSAGTTVRSRNAPCPCGSGKRYKECHGAMGGTAAAASSLASTLLPQALAAQLDRRLRTAAELYQRVLADEPSNFDAMHMLGVVNFQRGRFDEAALLLKRAVALRPDIAMAKTNLALLEAAVRIEREISGSVLPEVAAFVDVVADLERHAAQFAAVHVVVAQKLNSGDRNALDVVLAACGHPRCGLWVPPEIDRAVLPDARVLAPGNDCPGSGLLVIFGAERSQADWLDKCGAESIVLVVTHDSPGELLDRVRELSHEGRDRIGLVYASSELARRLCIPGGVLSRSHGDARVAST